MLKYENVIKSNNHEKKKKKKTAWEYIIPNKRLLQEGIA